jgi:hypothetical protein
MFPAQETLLGIVVGGSIAVWLGLILNKPTVTRRPRIPACPYGCGRIAIHPHRSWDGTKSYFRGGPNP